MKTVHGATFGGGDGHCDGESGCFHRRDFRWSLIPVALHLVFVLRMLLRYSIGIKADPRRDYWDYFWQLLPADLLQVERWRSLLNLHAQPPLYNLLGSVMMRLAPPDRYMEAIYVLNVAMGAALCGLLYFPAQALLRRRWLSLALCSFVALHPSLLLYEAYVLYDVLTAFLVVATLTCVAFFCGKRNLGWLAGFVAGLNLLVLTRTIFHPAVLGPALLLVGLWAGRQWRRILMLALLISLPTFGWCAKNYVKFGFWGTTSWTGMNLWRIAGHNYSYAERQELVESGVLDAVVAARDDFQWPRELAGYGYNATSSVQALNRDNFNNINIPAASRVYKANAGRLIRHDPVHYARTVKEAFFLFCRPSFEFSHLIFNGREIPRYLGIWRTMYGRQPAWLVKTRKSAYGSIWMVLHVLALVVFVLRTLREWLLRHEPLVSIVRRRPMEFALAYFCLWVALVGCMCEIGENDRFKFVVEFPAYVFVVAMLSWAFQGASAWLTVKVKGLATAPLR